MKYYLLKQSHYTQTKGLRVFLTFTELKHFLTNNNYSIGHYKKSRRSDSNFNKTNLIILDIDKPQLFNLEELTKQLKIYKYILAPTKSHLKIKNDISIERYRLILFTKKYLYTKKEYEQFYYKVCSKFDLKPDEVCRNPSHYYEKSISIYSFNSEGEDIWFDLDPDKIKKSDDCKKEKFKGYAYSQVLLSDELKKWINKEKIKKKSIIKREKFVRLLISQRNLLRRSILPQKFISQHIGVTRKTLSLWIKELVAESLLIPMNDLYFPGKAKDYKALNSLRKHIEMEYSESTNDRILPTSIEDGEWEQTVIKVAWKFCFDEKPDDYFNWGKSLPTINDKPERFKKLERAWRSVKKYMKSNDWRDYS